MTDTVLQLGDFQFARFEVPERIPFGGEQKLIVHELVGGARVIDAMGEEPAPLEWSGFFVGEDALDRALYLDGLRKVGGALPLTWSELAYTVVIRGFHCDFERFYRLPYRIQLEVVSDDTSPITTIAQPSPEQSVSDDLNAAADLSHEVGDDGLTSIMANLAIAAVALGSLTTAAPSTLNTLLQPIAAARARAQDLMAVSDAALASSAVGGVTVGASVAEQAAALTGQVEATTTLPTLLNLDRTLGRLATNLQTINGGQKSVTTGGGNLYALAAQQYGDPMGWTSIAAANGLFDPELFGITTLAVPPAPTNPSGILSG